MYSPSAKRLQSVCLSLIRFLFSSRFPFTDTIENSIDNVGSDVEAGRSELVKAAEYQAKYRRKVIILLLIAVIIGMIITGLVVSQLKN